MIYKEHQKKNISTSQSLMGGAMVLTVALIVVKIVGAVYRFPHTVILGEDGLGVYNQAYDFYGIVYAVAVTGFPAAIGKIIVGYARAGRYNDIRRTLRVANLFFIAVGVVASLVLALFARVYSSKVLENPNVFYAIVAVAPSVLFSCLMCTHRGYHQGMRNMMPTAVSQVVEVVVKAAVGLTVAYIVKAHFSNEFLISGTVLGTVMPEEEANVLVLSLAAAASMLGVTLSTFAGWIYMLLCSRRRGEGMTAAQLAGSPAAQTDRYLLRQILVFGVPAALGAAATTFTGLINGVAIQKQILKILETDAGALFRSHGGWLEAAEKTVNDDPGSLATFLRGCYGYGFAFFNLVPAITGSFGMSAMPHIADAWMVKDRRTAKGHIDSTFKITMLIAAPLGFGMAALGAPILHLLFSRSSTGVAIGGPLLSILGVASILLALYSVSNTILQAIGRFDIPVKLLAVGGVLNVAVTYFLVGIPSLNIKVAPVGMTLGYLLVAILSLYYLVKNTEIRVDYTGAIAKPLLAGIISGFSAYIVYELQILLLYDVIRQKFATVIAIIVAAVVYFIAVSWLRVITEEDVLSMPRGEKILKLLEKMHIVR